MPSSALLDVVATMTTSRAPAIGARGRRATPKVTTRASASAPSRARDARRRATSRIATRDDVPRRARRRAARARATATDVAIATATSNAADPVVGVAFGVAAALLVVITGGMAYVALGEALDRGEEARAREEDARRARATAANARRFARRDKATRMTPSQRAAMETGGGDARANASGTSANRRARRRATRAGEGEA